MSESTHGRHRRPWFRIRRDFEKFRRDAILGEDMGDEFAEITDHRVTALEEILAARWPRSILVRRRLARDIRASVAHVQGATFAERRTEAIGTGWIEPWGKR